MLPTYRSRRIRSFLGPAALVGAAALGGCATIDNDRLSVAGADLPAFAGPGSPRNEPLREATGPSLSGVDRSNWALNTIAVPSDGTRHHPRLSRTGPRYDRSLPRNRGLSPTATTAADLGSAPGPQVWEGWSAPAWAGMDVLLAIPRAVRDGGPLGAALSPDSSYQRDMVMVDPGAGAPSLDADVAPIGDAEPAKPRR